jgi:hypothetical protein
MTQTAVEWLEKEFVKLEVTIGVHGVMYEIIEQAKKMEKEQLENAWYAGDEDGAIHEFEYYYNETFKKD